MTRLNSDSDHNNSGLGCRTFAWENYPPYELQGNSGLDFFCSGELNAQD